MSPRPPAFDHRRDAAWLMAYADDELPPERAAAVAVHLETCAACRAEVERWRREARQLGALRLREPPAENWEAFWERGYNRYERRLGEVLAIAGLAVVLGYGLYLGVVAVAGAAGWPWWCKAAVFVACAGGLGLFISVLREQLYAGRLTRYKDVQR